MANHRTTPAARARGQAAARPQAVMEYAALAAAVASTGKSVSDVVGTLAPLLKSKVVLLPQVLRSGQVGHQHRLVVRLSNVTPHGVYLEGMKLQRPKDVPLTCRMLTAKPIGIDQAATSEPIEFPLWIGPGEVCETELSFDAEATSRALHNWLWGTVSLTYQLLSARDPAEADFDFSIRTGRP